MQQIEHVQWLTGARYPWTMSPAAALRADGHLTLVAPKKPVLEAAADEVVHYEAQWHSTLRNDQRQASSVELLKALDEQSRASKRIGVEFSCFTSHLAALPGERIDIEPTIYRLRRQKDPDELARIRKAIAGTQKDVRAGPADHRAGNHGDRSLQSAASRRRRRIRRNADRARATTINAALAAGTRATTARRQDGELYILDLGPAFRGYFSDNCRTIRRQSPADRRAADGLDLHHEGL